MATHHVSDVVAQKAANAGAVGSSFLAGATWLVEVELYLQIGATLVAIVAGGAAAWYHIERARYMRRKNREADNREDEE